MLYLLILRRFFERFAQGIKFHVLVTALGFGILYHFGHLGVLNMQQLIESSVHISMRFLYLGLFGSFCVGLCGLIFCAGKIGMLQVGASFVDFS